MARLASYMANTEDGFFLTSRNTGALHECIGAYIYAAEMSMPGVENIYDSDHYIHWVPGAETDSRIEKITLPDPYLYPPQFLLIPRAAIALTHDIDVMRLMWLAIQVTLVLGTGLALAFWIGGRAGVLAGVLFPLVLISIPSMRALHFGQFHLVAIALSLGGMLAFEKDRRVLGAGMLGFAIVTKMFPALLPVGLAVQRRWAAVAYTVGAAVVISGLAYVVIGPQPFVMFMTDMLPRLADGSATRYEVA